MWRRTLVGSSIAGIGACVASPAEVLRQRPYPGGVKLAGLYETMGPRVGTNVERRELIELWPEVLKHVAP